MDRSRPKTVERLLSEIRSRDEVSAEQLFPVVYAELRAVAARCFRKMRAGQTLQPTALVHEAYLHIVRGGRTDWNDRAHFFAVAATAVRQILIQHARKRETLKRGGRHKRMTLSEGTTPATSDRSIDVLSLDEAMMRLEEVDERAAQVVQLKFFGGLTIGEVAQVLDLSTTTVEDDWNLARAWLRRELSGGSAAS